VTLATVWEAHCHAFRPEKACSRAAREAAKLQGNLQETAHCQEMLLGTAAAAAAVPEDSRHGQLLVVRGRLSEDMESAAAAGYSVAHRKQSVVAAVEPGHPDTGETKTMTKMLAAGLALRMAVY
jgi:hypothetical protein